MSATAAFIFGLLLPSVVIFSVIYLISLRIDKGLKAVALYLLIIGAYLLSKNTSNAITFFVTGILTLLAPFSFRLNKRKSKVLSIILLLFLLTFPFYAYFSSTPLDITYSLKIINTNSSSSMLMKGNIVRVNYTIINPSSLPIKAPYLFLCSLSHPIYSSYNKKEKIVWKYLKGEIETSYYRAEESIKVCFKYKDDYSCNECMKAKRARFIPPLKVI